jgi:hypothetical protein
MASRRNYFFRQKVQEDELDKGFALLEEADWNYAVDNGTFGIVEGLTASEKSGTPNLTIDVSKGAGYDQTGRRVAQPAALVNVDVSQDSNASSTTVTNVGNEKWVSVFIVFDRDLDDVREDGNGDPIYFVEDESYKFTIVQGAEASIGAAVKPSLLSNGMLVVDVRRTQGQTQIVNADLSTARREDAIVIDGAALAIRQGKVVDALTDIVDAYNAHIDGTGDTHISTDVLYGGGAAWLDGTTNPAGTLEDTLDNFIIGLKSTVSSTSGSQKLGSASVVGSLGTIAAGTIHSQILALKASSAIEWVGGVSWYNGDANGAQSVSSILGNILVALANVGASAGGDRISLRARTTWLGGRTNPITSVHNGIDKIITDLAATSTGDDGMERVGGQSVAGATYSLSAGSARSQVDELLGFANTNASNIATNTSSIATTTGKLPVAFSVNGDDADGSPAPFASFSTGSYTDGVALNVTGVLSGDIIQVEMTILCNGDFQNVARVRLQYIADYGGGSPSAQTNISGAVASITQLASSTTWARVTLQGSVTADRNGTLRIILVGKTFLDTLDVRDYSINAVRFRP